MRGITFATALFVILAVGCGDSGETTTTSPPTTTNGGSAGLVIGGGLTVEEALETDATGVIAVQGFIVSDESGIRLCDLLAESLPPLCGGASIEVTDLGTVDPDELTSAQGVTWTDQPVTILGEIVDGALVPTPFST